ALPAGSLPRPGGKDMMGYDEPASKRPALAIAPDSNVARPKRRWSLRLGLLMVALLGGAYAASRSNPDDPMPALTALASDPMKAIDSLFGQAAGGGGRGNRPNTAPPVRVALADARDVPVTVHTIGTVLANSVVNIKSQVDGP